MDSTTAIDASSAAEEIQNAIETISTMDPSTFWSNLLKSLANYLPKLLLAVIVLVVGILLVRSLLSLTLRLLQKSKVDPALYHFILSILRVALYVVLGISVAAILAPGAVVSLITVLGVFGLAISLAVKDSLSNLAGGLSVLFTKPFTLGDYVQIGAAEGTVKEIRLNYTVMHTVDNKVVHIPNGDVAKAQITNFSHESTRRLDVDFSIGYQDDFVEAEKIIREIISESQLALQEPAPLVRMVEHGDSAIRIGCRVWVNSEDYWTLKFDLLEEVKRRFDRSGISIPFNQLDVTVTARPGPSGAPKS